MKLFVASEIKHLDNYTIEHEPISSIALMERAATMAAYEVMARWGRNYRVVVFAGPGDNGGDALVMTRLLAEEGYSGEVYLFNPKGRLSTNCERSLTQLDGIDNFEVTVVVNEFAPPQLNGSTLVIDALFGVGLHSPLTGGFASLVEYINNSDAEVVSVDIPSGLMGEENVSNNLRHIVCADLTLTFQFPKLAFFFAENERFVGEWMALDIGIHPDAIAETHTPYNYTTLAEVATLLTKRKRFATKHQMGHVVLYAGSYGMMGAAVLSAQAVMGAGAGKLTLHTPQCGYNILQTAVPEAMVHCDTDERCITAMPSLYTNTVVAVGCGIGRDSRTAAALEQLLQQPARGVVIDADALNILADNPQWLNLLPRLAILTPHEREFDRLFGAHQWASQRLSKAIEVAKQYRIILVLKGANSAVVTPEGGVYFNSTGNAGMATAGSGDVLTGVIASLLAQGYSAHKAAVLGVALHGLAGDIAAEQWAEEGVTAGRIAQNLGAAFKRLRQAKSNQL